MSNPIMFVRFRPACCFVAVAVLAILALPFFAEAQQRRPVVASVEDVTATPTPTPTPTATPTPTPLTCPCGRVSQRSPTGHQSCECAPGLVPVSGVVGNSDGRCMQPVPANWRDLGIVIDGRRQDAAGGAALPITSYSVHQSGNVCVDVVQGPCGTTMQFINGAWQPVPKDPSFVNVGQYAGNSDGRWARPGPAGGGFNCGRQDQAGGREVGGTCCDWIMPAAPPPPPPPACLWYQVAVERNTGGKFESIHNIPMPPCLLNRLFSVVHACAGDRNGGDDCSARHLLGHAFGGGGGLQVVAFDNFCNQRVSSRWEIDANPACYAGYFRTASPISLLLDDRDERDGKATVTKFPLNPGRTNAWYQWYASERAPLLVHDPEHTGKITSATQLFGDWTFGGQPLASLAGMDVLAQAVKWNNGFEALATMDRNGDGEVSGAELEPLALWFDENRDGVSQDGEVRRLDETGITALYYDVSRVDSVTGSIYADKGYKRTVNGEVKVGRSVDWYGREAESKGDIALGDILQRLREARIDERSVANESSVEANEVAAFANPIGLTGLWEWQEKGGAAHGYLMLFEKKGGKLTGLSLQTAPLSAEAAEPLGLPNSLIIIPVKGEVDVDTRTARFSLGHEKVGSIKTTISLSKDGQRLEGASTWSSRAAGVQDAEYQWQGRRARPAE